MNEEKDILTSSVSNENDFTFENKNSNEVLQSDLQDDFALNENQNNNDNNEFIATSLNNNESTDPRADDDFKAINTHKKGVWDFESINSLTGFLYSICAVFAIVFVLSSFITYVLFVPMQVWGRSMYPTLNASAEYDDNSGEYNINTDTVLIKKLDKYIYKDIIVFEVAKADNPVLGLGFSKDTYFIKRIIACPGNTLFFTKEQDETKWFLNVYVNGNKLDESEYVNGGKTELVLGNSSHNFGDTFYTPYVKNCTLESVYQATKIASPTYTLADDEYFCMGDNRNGSTDCRTIGPIKESTIAGRVFIQVKYNSNLIFGIFESIKEGYLLDIKHTY